MKEPAAINLRAAIDAITLEVARPGRSDLATEISDRAISYITEIIKSSSFTDEEIARVVEAVSSDIIVRARPRAAPSALTNRCAALRQSRSSTAETRLEARTEMVFAPLRISRLADHLVRAALINGINQRAVVDSTIDPSPASLRADS